jgi:hypothetical protein
MNTHKLINLLPILIMSASLGFATYSVQPVSSVPTLIERAPGGKQVVSKDARTIVAGSAARGRPPAPQTPGRDPFQPPGKPTRAGEAAELANSPSDQPPSDPYRDVVRNLTLNATFLQGPTQMAVIDGRIYEQGQHLGEPDGKPSPLLVAQVLPNKVILHAGGKRYLLTYPDQFDSSIRTRNRP